jgi:hypothetical protein
VIAKWRMEKGNEVQYGERHIPASLSLIICGPLIAISDYLDVA